MKEVTIITTEGGIGTYYAPDCVIDTSEGTVTFPSDDRETVYTYNWDHVVMTKVEQVDPEEEAELREKGYL